MRRFLLLPFFAVVISCTSPGTKGVSQLSDTANSNPTKKIVKDNKLALNKKNSDNLKPINKLIGSWISDATGNVTFEIRENTFYYPQHDKSYKYELFGDSIKIKYDGFDEAFSLKLDSANVLELSGNGANHTYRRVK